MLRTRWLFSAMAIVVFALMLVAPAPALATPAFLFQFGASGTGKLNDPRHLASDGQGRVWVASGGNSLVEQFSSSGSFVSSWAADSDVEGIAVSRMHLIVTAAWLNNAVRIHMPSGAVLSTVGTTTVGSGNGQFHNVEDVALDRFGCVYVTDYGNNRVEKFDRNGTYIGQWGSLGSAPGQFSSPCGIAVDSLGYVYVVDCDNHRIEKFTSDGHYVTSWGTFGTGNGQFRFPAAVDVGQDGNIYVVDQMNGNVQYFTPGGVYLGQFGSTGAGSGQFVSPWGITSDGTGIYVADRWGGRADKFTLASAKHVTRIGGHDRYEVAANMARNRWGTSLVGVRDVIVVCGEDRAMADPLAAAGLAGILNAPVLLTKSTTLPGYTKSALTNVRAHNGPFAIHVIGGTGSVPPAIYNAIKATDPGGSIERINGADRYALSAQIALKILSACTAKHVDVDGLLLFNGQNPASFYDALAASPLSANYVMPMLALRNNSIPPSVATLLHGTFLHNWRVVVNSATYVPDSLMASAGAEGRMSTSADRATSAAQIADVGWNYHYTGTKCVSIANKLPDALTGGSYIGEQGGVLLYSNATNVPASTVTEIGFGKKGLQQGYVFGGTASVSDGALATFTTALNTP